MEERADQTFKIILDEDWQKGKYTFGYDPYESTPLNLYNRIKKFLKLKYKIKESYSKCVIYKKRADGTIEYIK